MFDPGFEISWQANPLGFTYGSGVFGPEVENRKLEDIRNSLRNPSAAGPEVVYSIVMDVGMNEHRSILQEKMLLFGVVTYADGQLGEEPVRSQGHIHAVSSHSGWSPPEIYEIWEGQAIIYMQETAKDDPGRCFAVSAGPGDVVVVPPNWAHATINADPQNHMTFGAWCDREYGFEYSDVRERKGLAWYPLIKEGELSWDHNSNYQNTGLIIKTPREYPELGLKAGIPIYEQFKKDPSLFQFVSKPYLKEMEWDNFIP